jgi:hypothetical protein
MLVAIVLGYFFLISNVSQYGFPRSSINFYCYSWQLLVLVLFIRVTFFLRTLRRNCTSPTNHLANNYFANIGVNHGVRSRWPLPSPIPGRRPNPEHRRHPHTMGDGSYTWFGRPPTTARVVGTAREGEKNVTGWECAATDVWGVY